MKLEDFDFELPEQQIAQHPLPERDASRLLVLDRRTGARSHRHFRDLPSLLRPGDLLVLNDTRVIPARLWGHKKTTLGRAELLLVRPVSPDWSAARALDAGLEGPEWICLGQASKGLKEGTVIAFEAGFEAEITRAMGGGEVHVRFRPPKGAQGLEGALSALLQAQGKLPLPPYISHEPTREDEERYQTVFARVPGSVAAPTASLHFTEGVLEALEKRGVRRAFVTLEVGPGTFLPVHGDIAHHKMHLERYAVPEATVTAVSEARARGGRVIAVGTTVVRTLESATLPEGGGLRAGAGETGLFITPGFRFRQVDTLITNFHLPKSTLLMLVSAFAGHEQALAAYREAVALGYRFFSYGDAMLISDGTP